MRLFARRMVVVQTNLCQACGYDWRDCVCARVNALPRLCPCCDLELDEFDDGCTNENCPEFEEELV